MGINWKLYRGLEKFSLIDAALLWMEIEPNSRNRDDINLVIENKISRIFEIINQYRWSDYKAKQANPDEAIRKLIVDRRLYKIRNQTTYFIPSIDWIPPDERGIERAEPDYDTQWENAKSDPVTTSELQELFSTLPPGSSDDVTRSELTYAANQLDERPKFLFPEGPDINGWNKGEVSKSSYKELIKVLCNSHEKINLGDKDAVGKIEKLAQLHGNSISDATIRSILDEVNPSRLNNSNRRTEKTR